MFANSGTRESSALNVKRNIIRGLACIALSICVLAFSRAGEAQVLYGSLIGTVTDPTGAVIAGAHIEALNVQTGVTSTQASDEGGVYRFSALLPGNYKVAISATGFSNFVSEHVAVNANTVERVDARLAISTAQQNVTVTAETPLLETDRADVHADLSNTEVQNLPAISSEGRSFQGLYKIIPGFTPPAENNSAAGNPQRAMTSSVNGQSTQGNNTRIDGVLDAYPWLPNNVSYVPPIDSIETVNIVTNSYDAEQGQSGGAAINVVTKSGTNSFHGDAHWLHTDDRLSALNYFTAPNFKRPLNIFNQFGGAVGGPIKRDKLFFFADWESTRQNNGPAGGNPQTVPTGTLDARTAEKNGFFDFRGITDSKGNPVNIYDPRTGNPDGTGRHVITCNGVQNEICLSDVDPAALTMAKLIPTANVAGATTNNYFLTKTGFFHRDDIDGKITWVPSSKSTVFGRYSFSRSLIFDPPAFGPAPTGADGNATNGGQLGNAYGRIQVLGLGTTYTFSPNLLFDGNFGFTRQRIDAENTDLNQNFGLDVLKIPGTNGTNTLYGGEPAFQFNTYSPLGNPNTGNPFLFRDNQFVSNANMTWIKAKHSLRWGVELDHTQLNHFQPQGGQFQTARGSFKFNGPGTQLASCTVSGGVEKCSAATSVNAQYNSYAEFLLGLPDEVGKAVQNENPNALRWSQWALYIRDQFQITSKLTVNYGVRWEYYPMATSNVGGARVLDPTTMDVIWGGGSSGISRRDGVDTGPGLFLPRVGIAYRPFEKTVIRAGYGMNADPNNWRFLRNAFPAVTISDFTSLSALPFAPAGSLTGLNAVGPYASLPVGIASIPLNGTGPGLYPLPDGIGTTTVPLDFRRGYIHSYNLTVEQEFARWVADLGYVGDSAIRPLENMNINPAGPGGGQNGRLLNAEFGYVTTAINPSTGKPFKGWSDINEERPFFNNNYNALQAKLTRRFSGSTTLGFAYTYSRAINYEDNEEINFILFPYPAFWPKNRGVAGFDRTHNFEAYGVYELPFGDGKRWATSGIPNKILGGWQFNWVLSAMSGTPFTVIDSGSGATALNAPGNTQTVNIIGPIQILNNTPLHSGTCKSTSCDFFNPAAFASVSTPATLGNAGRDILRGPGLFNLDTSLFRNFKITERLTFQFQVQAYSLTNTPHFNNPVNNGSSADISRANFGAITSTINTPFASLNTSSGQRTWYFAGQLIF
jgi:hypothetical protein